MSSFDALGSPLIPQKCHPVVNAEAIPLSLEQICCVNNSKSREAESSSRTKKEVHDTGMIIRFQTTLTSSRQRLRQLQRASALPAAPSCGRHIHSTFSLSVTTSNKQETDTTQKYCFYSIILKILHVALCKIDLQQNQQHNTRQTSGNIAEGGQDKT